MRGILTLNAGSSSLKFALFGRAGAQHSRLLGGQIAASGGAATFQVNDANGLTLARRQMSSRGAALDPNEALDLLIKWLATEMPKMALDAVGHRVVHGGARLSEPILLDDKLIAELTALAPLAPLHQPFNLAGIAAARKAFPSVPQVACFDTAFHSGHAFELDSFGLPRAYYDEGIRRYGFHGLSYEYVTRQLASVAPAIADGRIIIAHLGNGASLCAVRAGRSVTSTMGFSALDGLIMGTRCGAMDPGVLLYLMAEKQMDAAALTRLLYKNSGLKGISGISHDMRELESSKAPEAAQAIACFVTRIRREIGALTAVLGGLDALVFTGGIGEHSVRIRAEVMAGFDWLGLAIDPARNTNEAVELSAPAARVRVLRIATDEEAMIARHVIGVVMGADAPAAVAKSVA
jgi:acetate kinase